jgi:hypothetical protein
MRKKTPFHVSIFLIHDTSYGRLLDRVESVWAKRLPPLPLGEGWGEGFAFSQ